jgi:DNA-binding MurR/RpiR family transcriptional regulator
LDSRILDLYESLAPMERRLADVLLEHQRDLASYSATELARRAEVSKATAARLFRRLGYDSFAEARRQARSLRHWGSPLNIFEQVEAVDGSLPAPLQHVQTDLANLSRTFEALHAGAAAEAADLLAGAERIWVVGFRASRGLAELLHYWLSVVRAGVQSLQGDGMAFAEIAIDFRPGDAVVAIGFRRRTRLLRALLARAHATGTRSVLITDVSASASAKLADVVLRCHSRPAYLFDSYSAAVSLLNFLVTAVAVRLGDSSRERMRDIDDLHEALDAFTTPVRRQRTGSELGRGRPKQLDRATKS